MRHLPLPRQIISDEESSVASSGSQANRPGSGRPSLLYRTSRRGTGVEMDLATREANELLQKGKDALEAAGNMRRECKATAHECLQGLFETALSLADSRAHHKYNLEKDRDLMTLKVKLSLMRMDVSETKKEAKGIREWLRHETLEALQVIKEAVKSASFMSLQEHEKTRQQSARAPGDPKWETMGADFLRLDSHIAGISNQLDVLRKALERLKEELNQPKTQTDPSS